MKRALNMTISENNAFFLWGPRKIGKTTFLKTNFPEAKYYDLLDTDILFQLTSKPAVLRQEVQANKYKLVIVDEVQKIPLLLNEIHWCLENTRTKFILCGSSARKLKKSSANLLGGRAWRYEMFPFTSREVKIELEKAFNRGLIPQHYLAKSVDKFLYSYVTDYVMQEIKEEALVRNIPAFSRFLENAAISNGELINFANIARDSGVSAVTVKEYYQILEDTLMGYKLLPWKKSKKRRMIETAKFYFFDHGVVRALLDMIIIQKKTAEYGKAFEHFIINEVRAFVSYQEKYQDLFYWRTSSGLEVDLIIGKMLAAIEIKAREDVHLAELKGLVALQEEFSVKHKIVVYLGSSKRLLENNILLYPWEQFLDDLWNGKIV